MKGEERAAPPEETTKEGHKAVEVFNDQGMDQMAATEGERPLMRLALEAKA